MYIEDECRSQLDRRARVRLFSAFGRVSSTCTPSVHPELTSRFNFHLKKSTPRFNKPSRTIVYSLLVLSSFNYKYMANFTSSFMFFHEWGTLKPSLLAPVDPPMSHHPPVLRTLARNLVRHRHISPCTMDVKPQGVK